MKAQENYKVSKDCEFVCINFYKYTEMVAIFFIGLFVFLKSKHNTMYSFNCFLNEEEWVGLTKKVTKEKNSEIVFPWQVELQSCYCSTYCSYLLNPNSSQITA